MAYDEAAAALRNHEFNEVVGEEAEIRRALVARIAELERRLLEIESQLEAEKP